MPKNITTIEELGDEMRTGFRDLRAETQGGFKALRDDIKLVNDTLVGHDKRTDAILEELQKLTRLERLERRFEQLRAKLNVEV